MCCKSSKPRPIAAYCFILNCYFYWDAELEGFNLMEVRPGELVRVEKSPIRLIEHTRNSANYGGRGKYGYWVKAQ